MGNAMGEDEDNWRLFSARVVISFIKIVVVLLPSFPGLLRARLEMEGRRAFPS
jgi:hypothetical protein